jgi:hypothetical protein
MRKHADRRGSLNIDSVARQIGVKSRFAAAADLAVHPASSEPWFMNGPAFADRWRVDGGLSRFVSLSREFKA